MTSQQTIDQLTSANQNLVEAFKAERMRAFRAERRAKGLKKELAKTCARRDHWFKERERELDNNEVLQKRIRELATANEQLRAKMATANPNGAGLHKVYEIDLPGYEDAAGEGMDGVLWMVLDEQEAEEIESRAIDLGNARFVEVEGHDPDGEGGIDYDSREPGQMDALIKRMETEIERGRYPVGTRLISLTAERDDDENGEERITPAGSEWIVTRLEQSNGAQARHLGCNATGAWVIPSVRDIEKQFTVKPNIGGENA